VAFSKWVSLVLMVVTAAVVAGIVVYFQSYAWPARSDYLTIGVTAASAGAIVSLVHMFFHARQRTELSRLRAHVEAVGSGDARHKALRVGIGLLELGEAIDESLTTLRQRVDSLISQRRELEVQLRVSDGERRHAEAILNSIADAVVVTDAFNEVALVNQAAARIFRFDPNDALRRPVEQIIQDPMLIKLIKDTREGGDASLRRHLEHELGGMQRSSSVYNVTMACVTDSGEGAGGETVGVVTILRDITREKEISEMKSDFVSSVSHELRTPLSSIKAYVEMLVDGEANDEQTRSEFYNIIQGETNRLQRLIDNILNISRIESGVVKVQREHVSLPTVIGEVMDVMQPQARAKHIELVEVQTPLFFQIFADKDMVYQATLNLVSNAIKYTPEGGKVTVAISVDEHAKMVRVSVSDTGVGIPEEDLPHLFDKFYRVANHKKLAKGTGLGLNLVKQIIETVHGGEVSVSSEYEEGSTFTYCLPMADNVY